MVPGTHKDENMSQARSPSRNVLPTPDLKLLDRMLMCFDSPRETSPNLSRSSVLTHGTWSQTQASIEKMAGWLGNLATTVSGGKIANIAGASLEEARPVDPKLPTNEQGHSANIPARQRSEHEERAYQIKVSYVNDVQLIYATTCATGKNESWSLLSKSV